MPELTYAEGLAASLPTCTDYEVEGSDLMSLCDIVVVGVETEWEHFGVSNYQPNNDGSPAHPWAILHVLPSGLPCKPGFGADAHLTEATMRRAVKEYLQSRLTGGMSPVEAARLVDGSYTDAEIADSILQFAIYGEEVFG